jgi:hypothetical protein
MEPVLVTKRPRGIAARSGTAWALSLALMVALLAACGEGSPEASSPTSPSSTSPTKTVAASPQKIAPTHKKIAPSPKQSVSPSPPTSLDKDVRQAIVRYTQDRAAVVVEAKVDPTRLSQGSTSFHGFFQAPFTGAGGRFWEWEALFPMGVQASHQLRVQNAYSDYYGCGPQGLGRNATPKFTATVNREDGTIKAVIPSRCISEQGVEIPPVPIRASVNVDYDGSGDEGGVGTAHFTDPLFPGDVAVQRR